MLAEERASIERLLTAISASLNRELPARLAEAVRGEVAGAAEGVAAAVAPAVQQALAASLPKVRRLLPVACPLHTRRLPWLQDACLRSGLGTQTWALKRVAAGCVAPASFVASQPHPAAGRNQCQPSMLPRLTASAALAHAACCRSWAPP